MVKNAEFLSDLTNRKNCFYMEVNFVLLARGKKLITIPDPRLRQQQHLLLVQVLPDELQRQVRPPHPHPPQPPPRAGFRVYAVRPELRLAEGAHRPPLQDALPGPEGALMHALHQDLQGLHPAREAPHPPQAHQQQQVRQD